MLLEFRKSFANNDDKYPKDLSSMIDVMRQQPEAKKPCQPKNDQDKDKTSEEGASNFSQTDKSKQKWACFCCGDEKCRLSNCTKKATLPEQKWFKPDYYDTWHAQSNAQTNAQTRDSEQNTCQSRSCLRP